ncbi:MAG TPA: non-homologous end-joining DNA ligase [Phycisphaerae bacterium]|nr:non-homologous end-joining DNA ligase [Phycisphaerae bacterium]
MKAVLAPGLPAHLKDYAFEFKWDGVRMLAFYDGKNLRLLSRNNLDATFRYPELHQLGKALGKRTAILDGEIIAIDERGQPSFPLLQTRMNVTRPEAVARAAKAVEIAFCIFDVLYLDGRDLRDLPWTRRREVLESLADLLPPPCRLSPARVGKGKEMLEVARDKGLEGVMAKRTSSAYLSGERSDAWLKVKLVGRQELVIGGWVPEVSKDGHVRTDHIGAIVLGYYEKKEFRLAGAVGTGFTDQSSRELVKRLRPLETSVNPFSDVAALRKFRAPLRFVQPQVVVEVEYRRWPDTGLMQQAAFKGVREDKPAKDVVRELPSAGK